MAQTLVSCLIPPFLSQPKFSPSSHTFRTTQNSTSSSPFTMATTQIQATIMFLLHACVPPTLFNLITRHFALVHSVPATLASMVLDFPRHAPTSGPLQWCLLHRTLFPRKPHSYSPLLLVHDSEIIFSVSLPWQPKSNLPIPHTSYSPLLHYFILLDFIIICILIFFIAYLSQ